MLPYRLPNFELDRVLESEEGLQIHANSLSTKAVCPECRVLSSRTHGWYSLYPQELPSVGCKMRLELEVRRFRCMNPLCSVKTFAERFSNWLPPYARRTKSLTSLMHKISLSLGAESGQRILAYLGAKVSGDTLLRILRKEASESQISSPRVVGVDDWAFKRGKTYGSILVDLESHRVIDLLPDRKAETLSQWLKSQPSIEIVSRDRSTDYAAGIREGAPQALQVADRWHLLLNLRQMLERYLSSIYAQLQVLPMTEEYETILQTKRPAYIRTHGEIIAANASREKRIELYEKIQAMREEGWNITQLASELGHHRETIRKYFYATSFPERQAHKLSGSILDPYIPYLEQRLQAGCENAFQLWREIQAQGYRGSQRQIHKWLQLKRTQVSPFTPHQYRNLRQTPSTKTVLPSAKQLAWLLVRDPVSLSEEDQILLHYLQQDQQIQTVYAVAQRFVLMIKQRLLEALDPWLVESNELGIIQFQNFAQGLQADYSAVRAALATTWSNGQTEGQVNRLKFIKRQMYGRAKFDLLRLRVLAPP